MVMVMVMVIVMMMVRVAQRERLADGSPIIVMAMTDTRKYFFPHLVLRGWVGVIL